jgi:hypothetical protein
MKNIRIYLVALCALALSAGSFLLSGAGASHAQLLAQDVRVINKPANPVPVQSQGTTNIAGNVNVTNTPSVSIANTPTVSAQEFGQWNVNISNKPTVTLDSSAPVNVRDVDNPALQPFQRNLVVLIPPGQNNAVDQYSVPAGKRLVIEFTSTSVTAPTGMKLWVRLQTFTGGVFSNYNLTSTLLANTAGTDFSVGSQTTRIYADPGSIVTLVVNVLGATAGPNTGAEVDLSGHFVDVP